MLLRDIQENFPFISVVTYGGLEYVGIIINQDQWVTSMYVFTDLKTEVEKKLSLQLGETWWWESNRMIPINIFLRDEMTNMRYAITTMNSKDVRVSIGPTVNLGEMQIKRIKRKSVQLIRNPKK